MDESQTGASVDEKLSLSYVWVSNTERDMRRIWTWRQDPSVVSHTLSGQSESFESFSRSFRWRYFQLPSLLPFFVVYNGEKIGVVRFRPFLKYHGAEVSILLAEGFRGKGIGREVLKKAEEYASVAGIDYLYALIFPSNIPSMKLFLSAGFYSSDTWNAHQKETVHEAGVGDTIPLNPVERGEPLLFEKKIMPLWQEKEKPLFFIAEIGSNWLVGSKSKNRQMALKLIESAKNAGCNAVKFQVYRADELYAPSAGRSNYLMDNGIDQNIRDLLKEHEVDFDDICFLAESSAKMGLEFMSSAFSSSTFKAVDPFVQRHKIASYEITDPELLQLAAETKKPIILSTGAARLPHIAWAVETIRGYDSHADITVLQCTAQYPADMSQMNISCIKTLQTAFNVATGLSDHSIDPLIAPIMAVAFGASVIEKHITLSKQLPGPDHAFALEPDELKECVKACRAAEAMRGNGRKEVMQCEKELFFFAQRALQALTDIEQGEKLAYGINYRSIRPGSNVKGIHPLYREYVEGKPVKKGIRKGSGILMDYL